MPVRERWKRLTQRNMTQWLLLAAAAASLAVLLSVGLVEWRASHASSQPPDAIRLSQDLQPLEAPALGESSPGFEDPEWGSVAALDPSETGGPLDSLIEPWPEVDAEPGTGDDAPSTLDCIIEPFHVVAIGSPVTGLIEKLHVERGDSVEEGQILVELESSVERAAVDLARARAEMSGQLQAREASLALGRRNKERAEKLFDQDALSFELRDTVETEAEVARLEVQQAREEKRLASLQLEQALAMLERRVLRSPIPGVVVERLMSRGERVEEETILKVAQIDPLRVEVILPAAMFDSIRPGMRATVIPEFPGDRVHVASVTIVDRVIDAASGTFGARLDLPNPDGAIPAGLRCQARFLTE
jgi:RND family efflux transporter MFP subunit